MHIISYLQEGCWIMFGIFSYFVQAIFSISFLKFSPLLAAWNDITSLCFLFSLMWHCEKGCLFDICYGCTRPRKSLTHPHRLQKCNPNLLYPETYRWSCNVCGSDFMHESQEKPFNCKQCRFDICFKCLKGGDNKLFFQLFFTDRALYFGQYIP